jgi:hypothetical protein
MIISQQEEHRQKKIGRAIRKWTQIAAQPCRPPLSVIAYLTGFSRVYKFELNEILGGF